MVAHIPDLRERRNGLEPFNALMNGFFFIDNNRHWNTDISKLEHLLRTGRDNDGCFFSPNGENAPIVWLVIEKRSPQSER